MTARVVGSWPERCEHAAQQVSLQLNRHRLRKYWQAVGEVADFMADYLAAQQPGDARAVRQLRDSASFVINELLENAVKYSRNGTIRGSGSADDETWTFLISHDSSGETADGLVQFLDRLAASTPEELMIEQVERNAELGSDSGSGLGIVSILADYGATMAWKIEAVGDGRWMISTLARLPVGG